MRTISSAVKAPPRRRASFARMHESVGEVVVWRHGERRPLVIPLCTSDLDRVYLLLAGLLGNTNR